MRIIRRSGIILIAIGLLVACQKKEGKTISKTVTIYGSIVNYEQDTLFLEDLTANTMLLKDVKHKIPLNANKEFSYTFEIDKPRYFQSGRCFFYFSPGDSLQLGIDTKTRATTQISGKGSEANLYLRDLPYPKGGSFFGDLRQQKIEVKTKEEMVSAFKPILEKRMDDLATLQNVSEEFRELEKARLQFEYVNTLQSSAYLYIYDVMDKKITEKEFRAKTQKANDYLLPNVTEVLSKIDYNKGEYIQLEVFQGILSNLNDDTFTTDNGFTTLSANLKEYQNARTLKQAFSNQGYTKEFTDFYDKEIVNIKNPDYLSSLDALVKEYETLKTGQPATDVTFVDLEGNNVKLSDYKGKVVVIDLWATWCGPCMDEKPSFEALVEKYKDNDNIALLSVSIDTKKVWDKYFTKETAVATELQINRSDLSAYQIVSIPRLFVIDKNQNIVDVFAPAPSTGKLEEMFKAYL